MPHDDDRDAWSFGRRDAGRRLRAPGTPALLAALVCAALGAVSVLTLPSLPSYDPFAWVVWGREIAHQLIAPHQAFVPQGGPSWKPLPVLFTTVFGFFGPAPQLWVAFARAVGLFGLFIAYRLGSRLATGHGRGEPPPRWSLTGPVAGTLAAAAVCLTSQWVHYMFRGTSEPMVVTATLGAIDLHLCGRRMGAFWCGVALALMRPEAGLFVAVYAVWCLITVTGWWRRLALVAGMALVPAGWLVPPWLATGYALEASTHARRYNGHLGTHPFVEVLHRAINLTTWPMLVAALVATVLALGARERTVPSLAALSIAYVAVVEAMTLHHYPGLERFMLPAATIVCVLAGVAVARVASLAGGGAQSAALATALVAITTPVLAGRVAGAALQPASARQAVRTYDQMVVALREAGATRGHLLPCRTSYLAVNHTVQPALAWALDVPLTDVLPVTRTDASLHRPALAFFAPHNANDGGAPHAFLDGLHARLLHREEMWRVLRITRTRDMRVDACVGT